MDEIIVSTKKADSKVEMTLYEFLDEFYKFGRRFAVCHVTEEEYEKMSEQIERGFLYEKIDSIQKIGYDNSRWMIAADPLNKALKFSNYNDIDNTGSYIFKDGKLEWDKYKKSFVSEPDSNKYSLGIKVYTTETYDNVIAYYQQYMEKQQPIMPTLNSSSFIKAAISSQKTNIEVSRSLSKKIEAQRRY